MNMCSEMEKQYEYVSCSLELNPAVTVVSLLPKFYYLLGVVC